MGKAAQKVESLESQLEDTKRLLEKLNRELLDWKQKAKEEAAVGLKYLDTVTYGYRIYQQYDGNFNIEALDTYAHPTQNIGKAPLFSTRDQASAFAKAFETMLAMRAQPGVTSSGPKEESYCIIVYRDGTIQPVKSVCKDAVPSTLFARFETREDAERAITIVGRQRIMDAAKTLSFTK